MREIIWEKNLGQNGWDPPTEVGPDQCVRARNVHFYDGGLGTRRGGSSYTGWNSGQVEAFMEFVPGQDETLAELFILNTSGEIRRNAPTVITTLTNTDLFGPSHTGRVGANGVTLNGKLYLAYQSQFPTNRIHVFDPGYSLTVCRKAGMGTPAAATVANTGAGAYAATLRYYRIACIEVRSGVTIRRGLLGPSVSFTPSGAGTAARITKPASLSFEGETHWEVYVSLDNVLYYALAANDVSVSVSGAIAIGTTTFDDSTVTTTYASKSAAPQEGANTPFPSVHDLGTDGARLYGFGVYETSAGDSLAPKNGRLYFGPVQDSSVVNDDERINNTTTLSGWIDVARNSGAEDRGVTERPVNNVIYAFQSYGIYAFSATGSDVQPYARSVISTTVGNLHHKCIALAVDRNGTPCAYFLDPTKGPYVVGGSDGLRWCGKDVADIWAGVTLNTTTPGWAVWQPDKMQVIFCVCTGGATDPNLGLVLDVTNQRLDEYGDLRGGWSIYDGQLMNSHAGIVFSNTLAATRSRVKVLHTSNVNTNHLLRYDETVFADDGTGFQAYVLSGALLNGATSHQLERAYVQGSAVSGMTISALHIRNTVLPAVMGGSPAAADVQTSSVSLTPGSSEQIVTKKLEDAAIQDAWALQAQVGEVDATNTSHSWQVNRWIGFVSPKGTL